MFKELLFNPRYRFDLEGNYLFRGQRFENDGTLINVDDFSTGKIYRFHRAWLGLIAYYEIQLPANVLSLINFVKFEGRHFNSNTGYLMIFREPIVLEKSFRVVPGYTRYHVNTSGVVKSINTGTILKQGINAGGYPTVSVYDDDKMTYRNVCLHILIARAWIKNSDPSVKIFVNHKDGVKSNYSISNLEWVTGTENSAHALRLGLNKCTRKCQVLDLENGSVSEYSSIGEARRGIDVSVRGNGPTYRKINGVVYPAILKNRYVIRTDSDPEFYKDLNEYKKLFSKHNKGPYYAKKLATGEIFEAEGLAELVDQIGININKIARAINSVVPIAIGGFVFKNTKEAEWPKTFYLSDRLNKRTFLLEDLETGEKINVETLGKLRSIIDADWVTIERKLKAKQPYKKWFFKETSESRKSYQTATSE